MFKSAEDEKYKISAREYGGEYALYNMPPYEDELERNIGFAHPEFHGYTFFEDDTLIEFTNLDPEEAGVMIGIGVAPEHCGKGYGQAMLQTTCALSEQLFP